MCKIPWCPYRFKDILDASYHIYSYQKQQIIRHPCKTKAFCPFFHFIKHISFSCTTLLVLWYSRLGPSCAYKFGDNFDSSKTCPSIDSYIHIKLFRFHAVPLFKLSNVIPLEFLSFKTMCSRSRQIRYTCTTRPRLQGFKTRFTIFNPEQSSFSVYMKPK